MTMCTPLHHDDGVTQVNGTVMRGLEHSRAADLIKAISHKAVIVIGRPVEENLSATGD